MALKDELDKGDTEFIAELAKTFVKTGELATKVADKNVVGAILDAKNDQKSILVEKLETFLGEGHKVYSNNTKTAKELLVPSVGGLLKDPGFKSSIDRSIKDMTVAENSAFQKAVRDVMSKPVFEIPTNENESLSWDWEIGG